MCVYLISAHLSITSRLNSCLCHLSVNFIILRCDWLQLVEFFSLSLFYILFLHDVLKAHKTQRTASAGNIYSFGTWLFFPSFFLESNGVQSDSYTLGVFLSDPEKKKLCNANAYMYYTFFTLFLCVTWS